MKLCLHVVRNNDIPGFSDCHFVVADADGEIMMCYRTEQEALDVIKRWA